MEALEVVVENEFEECLEFKWWMVSEYPKAGGDDEKGNKKELVESTIQMVLDRTNGEGPARPAKDAMVKQVPMGAERRGSVQNMPEARRFLISVLGKLRDGTQVRSPWVRATTLSPNTRPMEGNLDPTSLPRSGCKQCPCLGYVPQKFDLNSAEKMRCRRCGCGYEVHLLVEADEILKAREAKFAKKLKNGEKVTPLPKEALSWDNRECTLWFMSDGLFHPRETVGMERAPLTEAAKMRQGGAEGTAGKKGRVSVMAPTMESRQKFHKSLWECFAAQEWEDKELVVVETYYDKPSEFLAKMAKEDSRLVYVAYQRPRGADWSIGLKRNMCAHLASGEYIANFDDDDIYAPSYLTTMVPQLTIKNAYAVTLSSWYIFETKTLKWSFCDAIAWGWQKGMDSDASDVRSWAYGYGFSYVHKRQELMDSPYENINMGEDYGFVQKVIHKKGEKSVYLYHDEFGICLHNQHGENTSNSIPVREVDLEEAGYLDIADLPTEVVASSLQKSATESGQGRGCRMLLAHTLQGDLAVLCKAGVTVEEFLKNATQAAGRDLGPVKVFKVPVGDLTREADQGTDEWLAALLGFELDEPFVEPVSEESAAKVRAEKERNMAKARHSMHIQDRISIRTQHLWLLPASMVEDEEDEIDLGTDQSSIMVEITVQTTDAKSYLQVGNAIQARLPKGSTVGGLRELLKLDLPKRARVLERRQGRGLIPLPDDEPLPKQVTVTEFKGSKALYMAFSADDCRVALTALKTSLGRRSVQRQLDKIQQESLAKGNGNDKVAEVDFRGKLSMLLISEVYPPLFRYFGMPPGGQGLRFFVDSMALVNTRLDLAELWYEVERLMRNRQNMEQAEATIQRLREAGGVA